MNLQIGIITGLIAMFAWGAGDFLVAVVSRKIGNYRTLFWGELISFLISSIYFIFTFQGLNISREIFFLLILVALSQAVALIAFYHGLEKGLVSVVSPISSAYAVLVALVGFFIFLEELTSLQTFGIILILIGVPLISTNFSELLKYKGKILQRGTIDGLIAMVGWGVSFSLLIPVTKSLGWFLPTYILYLLLVIFLYIYGIASRQQIKLEDPQILKVIFIMSVSSIIGYLVTGYGFLYSLASVVTPITSIYPLVTIILARLFFKEKLVWNQVLGIVGVISGLILLGL